MLDMFYSIPGIIALLMLVITNFDIIFNRKYVARNLKALRFYRLFLLSSSLFYIADILWGILSNFANKTPVSIVTAFFFLFMAATVLAWSSFVVRYFDRAPVFKMIIRLSGVVVVVLGIGLLVTNFFYPILFSYIEGVYVTSAGRNTFLGMQFVMFSLIGLYAMFNSFKARDFSLGPYVSTGFFSIIMAIGITVQLYFPSYPAYTCSLAVGSMLVHTFIVSTEKTARAKELLDAKERELSHLKEIRETRELAYVDPLTGVKNKHAFVEIEKKYDDLIHDGKIEEFAVLIFDLNDLKVINDKYGHDKGDQYIIRSCEIISEHFKGLDLYRYGGDEFVIILEGKDYKNRYQMIDIFNNDIEKNIDKNEPVIALGFSDFIKSRDNTLDSVFIRADEIMYGRKRKLKQMAIKDSTGGEESTNKAQGANMLGLRYEMYEMFYRSSTVSLIDMLNASSCDELVEVDVKNDTFKQFYHVAGKYFVPAVNLSYRELLDFTRQHIVHPDDVGIYDELMNIDGFFERLKNSRIPNFDFAHFRYKLQDGDYRYVEQVVLAGEEYGIPEGTFRMYVFDIHNIKTRQLGKSSDEFALTSTGRDPITGLYTGKDFFKSCDEAIKEDPNKKWCLISVDIEHFKFFDEWFGRENGDYLLAKIGVEFNETVDKYGGVAGYFGADDFCILFEYDLEKIEALYERTRVHINSFGLSTGFLPAFGIAILEKDMIVVDAFDRATIAASKAKGDVKHRIFTYTYEMQFLADQEYRILTEFIHALQEDEITFFLQPQCHIDNGGIVGAEALARWIKKDGTIIPPGQFVPILEKYGFISDLDQHIWEKVCIWIRKRLDAGLKCVPVSLNVSQVDIFNLDLSTHFTIICDKYKVPHKLLKIEITESAYAKNMTLMDEIVRKLRKDGFMVLMDDFGSGYSSLNMLSNLKLDAIKLDANFLHIQGSDYERGIHILESVVNMAKTMALPMIVEGAEEKNQIDFLKELGCQYIQGYYFYKPMPILEFEKIIADKKNIDNRGLVAKLNEQFRIREFLDESIYSDSMLNNIIGSVAIYSLEKNHIDIVRFNQQFFEAVGVTEFSERLKNIEQFLPEEERPLIFETLKEAKSNKLMGASKVLRFYRPDGTISSFNIHFYYIGKKEGTDRFYGIATNVTELMDYQESHKLVAKFSSDNLILVKRVGNRWEYNVISHSFSDIIGLSPMELEEELNNGKFAKRITPQKDLKEFMLETKDALESKKSFSKKFTVVNNKNQKIKIVITLDYVGDECNNYKYILRTHLDY